MVTTLSIHNIIQQILLTELDKKNLAMHLSASWHFITVINNKHTQLRKTQPIHRKHPKPQKLISFQAFIAPLGIPLLLFFCIKLRLLNPQKESSSIETLLL